MSGMEPFDMSKTIQHPDVVRERISICLEQLYVYRRCIEARETEIAQLCDMLHAGWVGKR